MPSPRASDLLTALSIVGTLCYGTGWVFYNALFAQVNLEPEDVGVGLDFLFVRAALAIGSVVMVLAVLLVITGAFDRILGRREGSTAIVKLTFTAATVAFFFVSAGFFFTSLYIQTDLLTRGWALCAAAVGGAATTAIVLALMLVGLGYGLSKVGSGLSGNLSPTHLWSVSAILVLMLIAGSHFAGVQVGRAVSDGSALDGYVLTLRYVQVDLLSDVDTDIDGACLLRLGAEGGVEVLYDPDLQALHTVSSEVVVLSSYADKCSKPNTNGSKDGSSG